MLVGLFFSVHLLACGWYMCASLHADVEAGEGVHECRNVPSRLFQIRLTEPAGLCTVLYSKVDVSNRGHVLQHPWLLHMNPKDPCRYMGYTWALK